MDVAEKRVIAAIEMELHMMEQNLSRGLALLHTPIEYIDPSEVSTNQVVAFWCSSVVVSKGMNRTHFRLL
jgi:hypothetical protein